jgi:hypothetical protein
MMKIGKKIEQRLAPLEPTDWCVLIANETDFGIE